jgi:hypothetical protein
MAAMNCAATPTAITAGSLPGSSYRPMRLVMVLIGSVEMAGFGEVTSKAGRLGTRTDETNAAEPTGPDRRVA